MRDLFAALTCFALAALIVGIIAGGCIYRSECAPDSSWAAKRDEVAGAWCTAVVVCEVREPSTTPQCLDYWTKPGGLYDSILSGGPGGKDAGMLRPACVDRLWNEQEFTGEICQYFYERDVPRAPECR